MSDYISREAAEQIIAAQCGECADACLEFDGIQPDCNQCLLHGAAKAIKDLPAADVRPVVLCCDCKHFQINVRPSGYLPQGVPEWECRHWCRPTDPTDFCSYGEKMEESRCMTSL